MSTIEIRAARRADLPGVAEIYAEETENGYATFDLEVRGEAEWLAKLEEADPFLVAVQADRVLGFAYAAPFREKAAYHRTLETTVYVTPSAQGSGLGGRLYGELLALLREGPAHTALALVALPNPASVALHERAGFTHAGTMREVGDKFQRLIDVAIYQVMLEPTGA